MIPFPFGSQHRYFSVLLKPHQLLICCAFIFYGCILARKVRVISAMQQQHRFTPNPSGGTQRRNPNLNSNIMALPQQQLQVRQQTEHQDHNTNSSLAPPPLFERLATEEAAELKTYSRIIESQNRRLSDLEVSHEDLEQRLERETQKRISLQQDLDRQNLVWQNKYETLEKDRDAWKNMVNAERARNERLLDQVMRKDREIHRMIQRKVRPTE